MVVSLGVLVPFLTHSLVEWSWSIPLSHKIKETEDQGKRVLREVLYCHVPRELIERPKQGFGMPMARCLHGQLRDWTEALLIPVDLESTELRAGVERAVWKDNLSRIRSVI